MGCHPLELVALEHEKPITLHHRFLKDIGGEGGFPTIRA